MVHTSSPGGLTLHLRDSWKNCRVRGVTLRLRFLWFGSVRRREQDILRKFSRYYRTTTVTARKARRSRLPLLILFVRWSVLLRAVSTKNPLSFIFINETPKKAKECANEGPRRRSVISSPSATKVKVPEYPDNVTGGCSQDGLDSRVLKRSLCEAVLSCEYLGLKSAKMSDIGHSTDLSCLSSFSHIICIGHFLGKQNSSGWTDGWTDGQERRN